MITLKDDVYLRLVTRADLVRYFAYGKIIDVGCFNGAFFGEKAVNVDIIHYSLTTPNFVLADALHLPFKDSTFDCCVMSELLEHVDDPIKALKEAQRVALVTIISVPNEHEWHKSLNPFKSPGHKRFYTQESLYRDIQEAGLKLIQFFKINVLEWSHFIATGVSVTTEVKY